ncbi:MAG: rhomboid family intramembrane serine protease [Defluviitaleaceae bacterium]|nr:rhomboid family intramembrane serine protease [Defluviitaleaceae bacterium]
MYDDFVSGLNQTLAGAGYVRINMPYHSPCPGEIALWGRETGSMTYFYITYNLDALDTANFAPVKQFVDNCLKTVTERISARHSVAFNIFVGDLDENVNTYINQGDEFAFVPQYDMYFGVDKANKVHHHPKAPVGTDKSLKKMNDTLARLGGTKPILKPADLSPFAQPVAKIPIFAYTIIGVNILMFVLLEMTGGSQNTLNLIRFGAAQYHLTFEHLQLYRLFTPMFLHIGIWHLASNLMWLVVAGIRTERYLGHWKFLLIYLVSGVVGNVAMMLASPMAVGAGASGAVSGIFGALFAFMLVTKKRVENFDLRTMGTLIAVSTLMGFVMNNLAGTGNAIANAAHIGGLVAGFFISLAATKWRHNI